MYDIDDIVDSLPFDVKIVLVITKDPNPDKEDDEDEEDQEINNEPVDSSVPEFLVFKPELFKDNKKKRKNGSRKNK